MRLLVAALLAAALTGSAAAGVPAIRHTPTGMQTAAASLLTLKDLGQGWSGKQATSNAGIRLSCAGYETNAAGITEIGSAESPAFAAGSIGPFIAQRTSVYATTRQASTWWSRGVRPGLVACVAQSLAPLAATGIKVKIDSQGPLALPVAGDRQAAYRVVATLSTKASARKTYLDVVVIQSGRTISELTFSSLLTAIPTSFEHAVALIFTHRSGGAGPAA